MLSCILPVFLCTPLGTWIPHLESYCYTSHCPSSETGPALSHSNSIPISLNRRFTSLYVMPFNAVCVSGGAPRSSPELRAAVRVFPQRPVWKQRVRTGAFPIPVQRAEGVSCLQNSLWSKDNFFLMKQSSVLYTHFQMDFVLVIIFVFSSIKVILIFYNFWNVQNINFKMKIHMHISLFFT